MAWPNTKGKMPEQLKGKTLADRTPEERKAIGSKGGKAYAANIKKKKLLKEYLEILLSLPQTNDPDKNNYEGISIALINKALEGDTRAFEVIRDSIGQKPKDEVEVSGNSIKIHIEE